jgi:hypothetical protein
MSRPHPILPVSIAGLVAPFASSEQQNRCRLYLEIGTHQPPHPKLERSNTVKRYLTIASLSTALAVGGFLTETTSSHAQTAAPVASHRLILPAHPPLPFTLRSAAVITYPSSRPVLPQAIVLWRIAQVYRFAL